MFIVTFTIAILVGMFIGAVTDYSPDAMIAFTLITTILCLIGVSTGK